MYDAKVSCRFETNLLFEGRKDVPDYIQEFTVAVVRVTWHGSLTPPRRWNSPTPPPGNQTVSSSDFESFLCCGRVPVGR